MEGDRPVPAIDQAPPNAQRVVATVGEEPRDRGGGGVSVVRDLLEAALDGECRDGSDIAHDVPTGHPFWIRRSGLLQPYDQALRPAARIGLQGGEPAWL